MSGRPRDYKARYSFNSTCEKETYDTAMRICGVKMIKLNGVIQDALANFIEENKQLLPDSMLPKNIEKPDRRNDPQINFFELRGAWEKFLYGLDDPAQLDRIAAHADMIRTLAKSRLSSLKYAKKPMKPMTARV